MAKTKLKNKLQARKDAVENSSRLHNSDTHGLRDSNDSLIRISHAEDSSSESHNESSSESAVVRLQKKKAKEKKIKQTELIEEQNVELEKRKEDEYEKYLDEKPDKDFKVYRKKEKLSKVAKRVISIVLIVVSAYFAILTYGIITTSYGYNENKEVVPIRVTYDGIKDLKNYEMITRQYFACRSLYENVLLLDCRYTIAMSSGSQNDLIQIGTEYSKLLATVETLIVQINGLNLPSEYDTVSSQLLIWTKDYIAIYLQNMSSSILNKSNIDYNNAMEYRELSYNGFSIITENLANIGDKISGAETIVDDMDSWSPSKFVQENGFILD